MRWLLLTSYLFLLINVDVNGYITFDTGIEERYDYFNHTDFNCINNISYSYTNIFNGEFASKPKIIFSNSFYNIEYSRPSEYTFNITETTTTNFTTIVTCPQPQRFWGIRLTWIATTDERIQVINVFNQNMTNQGTKQYEYTHSNINALQGFVTKFSLGYIGMLDFNLTIDSITAEKVFVNFTSSNSNLLSIGYQIVLGNIGAFTLDPIFRIYTDVNSSKTYDTGYIPIPSGITLIFPYCGIYYTNINNIRQERINVVSNSSGIQYRYQSWYYSMVDLMLRKVWFKQINSQTFIPYLCKKARMAKVSDPSAPLYPQMTLTIQKLNLKQSTAFSQEFLLDKTYSTLNLLVSFQCNFGQVITGKFLKCLTCLEKDQYWIINQRCYKGMNNAKFTITLNQSYEVYQKIKVDVTTQGFTISQQVTNQVQVTYNVINLRIDPIPI